jgi:hypothetical protein
MSGVEASLVVGLISGTIQIIDGIAKAYRLAKDVNALPQAFREVAQRLPLVRSTLQTAESHIAAYKPDKDSCNAMKSVVESCGDKAKRLETIFQDVIPPADTPILDRYFKAVQTLGKGNRVETLMKGILVDVQLLAGNSSIKAATKAQVEKLVKAIEELSVIPPSLPEEDSSTTVANYGSGPQSVHTGFGDQYNASGEARQYKAHTMSFGKD